MDWIIPAITAAAGLGGAWIGGRFAMRAQEIAQRNESIRHTRELAFRTAVEEWKVSQGSVEKGEPSKPLDFFIIGHAIFLERFKEISLDRPENQEVMERYMRNIWALAEESFRKRKTEHAPADNKAGQEGGAA